MERMGRSTTRAAVTRRHASEEHQRVLLVFLTCLA